MLLVFCYEMFTLNIVLLFTVWKTISSVRGTVFYIKGPAFHSETHQIYSDWRCWLGGKKSIRPVNIDWWGAGVVICLDRGAYGPADDTASQNAIISCRQPHQHPHHSVFFTTGRMRFLPLKQQRQSTECKLSCRRTITLPLLAVNTAYLCTECHTNWEFLKQISEKWVLLCCLLSTVIHSQSQLARPLCCV